VRRGRENRYGREKPGELKEEEEEER